MMMAMIERMGAHPQVGGSSTTAMMLKMGTRRVVGNDDDGDNDREKGAHLRRRRVGDVVVDEVGDDVGDDNADVAKSERHQRRAKGTTTTTTTTSKEGLTNIDDTNVDSVEDSERASLREGRRGCKWSRVNQCLPPSSVRRGLLYTFPESVKKDQTPEIQTGK